MKLAGTILLNSAKNEPKSIAMTLDLGAGADAPVVQHSLHQMIGQMTNLIGLHQGATFVSLNVAAEPDA